MTPDFLTLPDRRLAYQLQRGRKGAPNVLFIGGYASDMTGTKAEFLAERCAVAGFTFLRFDCRGHGQSSGNFIDGTIGDWFDDASMIFDQRTEGPQIIIGSSMGGWLAMMLALKYPERVRALIGIAAGPDFTEDMVVPEMTREQQVHLERDGVMYAEASPPYPPLPFTKRLIDEAKAHLLLRKPLSIKCSVRLLQGMQDKDIPWQHAMKIADVLKNGDVRLYLVKDGEHRMSRPEDLDLLWRTIEEFV